MAPTVITPAKYESAQFDKPFEALNLYDIFDGARSFKTCARSFKFKLLSIYSLNETCIHCILEFSVFS